LRVILSSVLALSLLCGPLICSAMAQAASVPHDSAQTVGDTPDEGHGIIHLSAMLAGDASLLKNGTHWSIYDERIEADGTHRLVAQSNEAQPTFSLPNGNYMVHLAYGFASQIKRIVMASKAASERMTLTAGALEVNGVLGTAQITPDKLSLSVYVPEHGNPQAKLVVANAKPGQILRLPEGMYHIVSTYLDTVGVGSMTPVSNTNSVVNADLRVQTGKLVTATVKHRAAVLTLKLVNAPGGEALADTSFTILTPGGDVVRELIGAFPSLVLAEGDYVAIARHAGKTYQSEFKVESAVDRDVEISTQPQQAQQAHDIGSE
jgi:hypothetical protein